ncbi:hypothetical protein LTR36_001780 [Oleoguttula mirabilis]|uniref:Uncharacterized protein n=1 Tax=Oleoguttula mirabilis TaxID=1507867 RepID=A0AAV9JNG3_9PEZI|nr:hypothetical protein LTR36_001780 [Oleoguttula mirabilis]
MALPDDQSHPITEETKLDSVPGSIEDLRVAEETKQAQASDQPSDIPEKLSGRTCAQALLKLAGGLLLIVALVAVDVEVRGAIAKSGSHGKASGY